MNCGELEDRLVEVARGAIDFQVMRHAEFCSACALRLSAERTLTSELRAFASGAPGPPPHLEVALIEALGRNREAAAPLWSKAFAVGGAIAAALILAIGWRAGAPPPPPRIARIEFPAPAAAVEKTALAKRHLRRRPRPAPEPAVTANGFLPIPYAEPLSSLERAELVRVRMDSRIEADLVIGQDGLARAIRFVKGSPKETMP